MPMSWSMLAAHSSSRSRGSPSCSPSVASSSNMPSASAATCWAWARSTRYWAAMFSTLARRTSSNIGGRPLPLGGPVRGQEALAHEDRPDPPGATLARQALLHPQQLQRAAAQVQHAAVGERRGVDGGEIGVVGLLLPGEHPDRRGEALPGTL